MGDAVFAVYQAAEVLLENRDYKKEKLGKCVSLYAISSLLQSSCKIVLCATKPGLSSRNAMKSINSFEEVSNETMGIWSNESYMTMQQRDFFGFSSSTGSGSRVVFGCASGGAIGGASLGEGTRGPWGMVGVNL
jgi:hypothetical protein